MIYEKMALLMYAVEMKKPANAEVFGILSFIISWSSKLTFLESKHPLKAT
jgi:hypothetical protein